MDTPAARPAAAADARDADRPPVLSDSASRAVAARLSHADADRFRAACEHIGEAPGVALRRLILDSLARGLAPA